MLVSPDPFARPPRQAAPSAEKPPPDWWIEVASDRAALEKHIPAWNALAKNAVEPNVYFEPWLFLPGVDAFGAGKKPAWVFVYRRDPRPKQPPQLCGFFPFERGRFRRLPLRALRLWNHAYGFLCTPLVHRDQVRATLHALFDWVAAEERPALLDWPMIHGEGPFHQALVDVLAERHLLAFVDEVYTRALLRRSASAESYYTAALQHLSHKEWKRQRRRLGEQGKLESRVLQAREDVGPWLDHFLTLEASGWKGRAQTALAVRAADSAYFRSVAQAGHAAGQLQMLGMFLRDAPIALKCNFLTQNGGFAFKIAFDEAFAKFSPGVQLELDNIAELHRQPGLDWMDSCAIPGHFMINRLWMHRRTIQNVVIATSRWAGPTVAGAWPLLRALKRMIRP